MSRGQFEADQSFGHGCDARFEHHLWISTMGVVASVLLVRATLECAQTFWLLCSLTNFPKLTICGRLQSQHRSIKQVLA